METGFLIYVLLVYILIQTNMMYCPAQCDIMAREPLFYHLVYHWAVVKTD